MQMNAKRTGAPETSKKSSLSAGFIATALAAGMLLVGASGASATGTTSTLTCQTQWNDSPASEYCTTSQLLQVNATDPSDTECDIWATCSITFTHGTNGESSTTLTPSVSGAAGIFNLDDVDELDICVTETTASGEVSYTARLRIACQANEYTSSQTTTGQFHD